jgi:nondiscriminating glutamyl-tRNA synthetase
VTGKPRVRFAPSPTGALHIGGARTALYNWLHARHTGGTFILRIEDTDEVRSTEQSVQVILDGLKWLGLNWDEGPQEVRGDLSQGFQTVSEGGNYGPYFQMKRLDKYAPLLKELTDKGLAYSCYCTPEEVEAMRKRALLNKRPPKYDGSCRNLTPIQREAKEKEGRKAVLRFKTPAEGSTDFTDVVRGAVDFDNALLDDFVIAKAASRVLFHDDLMRIPTYNCAVVLDDHLMEITDVIRGDDHISNTPRQLLLYKAFGWTPPRFAHISMILGSDGSRLSKRHGATSLTEYRDAGYLPGAVRNYLALLGWSTEDSQQIFEKDELARKFTLERAKPSPAIFDPAKLLWMNGEYIRKTPVGELVQLSIPFMKKAGLLARDPTPQELSRLETVVALEHEKIKLLSDIPHLVDFLLKEEVIYEPEAVEKVLKKPGASGIVTDLMERFSKLVPFTAQSTEQVCRGYATEKSMKTSLVFHPVRVSVSGRTQGPSLFHMLEVLGKEKSLARMKKALGLFAPTS